MNRETVRLRVVRSLVRVVLGVALCPVAALAGVVGDGTPASCTLNALATEVARGGLVTFRCGGPATIAARSLVFFPENPPVVVDGEGLITLDGAGGTNGVVSVWGSKTVLPDVTLRNLTITRGVYSTGIISGGGINNGGKLTLENVTLSGNTAPFGGALSQQACSGCLEPSTVARRCTFSGNQGTSSGGAIVVGGGLLTVTDSTFRENTSKYAGAIYLYLNGGQTRTVASISGSTFTGNGDTGGVGVLEIGSLGATGSAIVTSSTFTGNGTSATTGTPAAVLHGGGATTTLSGLTIAGNTATASGAALVPGNGVVIRGSILSGNVPRNCAASVSPGAASADNLQWGDTTCPGFVSGDPRLGPLASNGGATATLLPAAGSAAIDAIPPGRCGESADQRGLPRPSGPGCDVGAVEAQQGPAPHFVPVVLSAGGLNGSHFTSEMTLTLRGGRAAPVSLAYTAFAGGGSGDLKNVLTLQPGRQVVIADVIELLRQNGLAIPATGTRAGTLSVMFEGIDGAADASVTVRTATPVPPASPTGRAGLAYAGIPSGRALHGAVALAGLREDDADRSNVAVQNAGTDGDVTLRLRYFRGEPASATPAGTVEVTLPPGGFRQLPLGDLALDGAAPGHGWVLVERTSGASPFNAYGVINDNPTSDGSYVTPVEIGASPSGLTLPVAVEASVFSTEVMVTNTSSETRTVRLSLAADGIAGGEASVDVTVPAYGQRILPSFVSFLRQSVPAGAVPEVDLVAPLAVRPVAPGTLSGISVSARVSNPAASGGRYGLFFAAVPAGRTATGTVFLNGLRQDETNRSNLALVNTGEAGDTSIDLEVTVHDGASGSAAATKTYTVAARRLLQIGKVLSTLAPGTTQGFVRVRRTAGTNPFLVYGVINDGAEPGQRSGDGAFLAAEE